MEREKPSRRLILETISRKTEEEETVLKKRLFKRLKPEIVSRETIGWNLKTQIKQKCRPG